MYISKYNAEGYLDLTAYEAIKNIEREVKKKALFRPLVYICSPFAGDVESNIIKAKRYCRFAVDNDYIPIAPHLLFPQFMNDDDKSERDLGLFFGMVLMAKCSEVWCFGSYISPGMVIELEKAKRRRTSIRYFNCDLTEVIRL